jgi:hypothetical protein
MSNACYGSLQACLIRVSKLTTAGAPSNAAANTNAYVSDAIVSLQVAVSLQQGDDISQKNGCGALKQSFKDCDKIKNLTLTMNLCELDADLIAFLTEATIFSSGGNTIGWEYPSTASSCPAGVCLEVWTKAWDGNQQAVPAFTSPSAAYWRWVFPRTVWTLGNVQMDNTIMVVPVTGTASENASITANGPHNDWPVAIAQAGGITRVGGVFLDDEDNLPTAACSTVAIPTGS